MVVHKVSQFKLLNQVWSHKMRVEQSNMKCRLEQLALIKQSGEESQWPTGI